MASNSKAASSYFLNLYASSDERPRWLPKGVVLRSVEPNGPSIELGANTFHPLKLTTDKGTEYRLVAVENAKESDKPFVELFETAATSTFGPYMKIIARSAQPSSTAEIFTDQIAVTPLALDQTNSAFLVGREIFAKYYRKIDAFNREASYYEKMEISTSLTPYIGTILDSEGRVESLLTGSLDDPKSLFQLTVDAIRDGGWDDVLSNIHAAGVALGDVHNAISKVGASAVNLKEWYQNRCDARGDRLSDGVVEVDIGANAYSVDVGDVLDSLGSSLINSPSHGDFHLGQCLVESGRVVIIDFEGEPVGESQRPFDSPIRDASGALRSLSYLVGVAMGPIGIVSLADRVVEMRREFLYGYASSSTGAKLVLSESFMEAIAFFEFEKACYELLYEKTFRPEWIDIPASSIRQVGDALKGRSSWKDTQGVSDRVESIANFYRS